MTGEQISRIFEPFTQAENSVTRRFGGTGLGLSISAQLVEMMGGSLLIESRPGEGSRFSFELWMDHAAGELSLAAPSMTESREKIRKTLEGKTVLLVEDNRVNQMVAEKMLEKMGVKTVVVSNGQDAIETLFRGDARTDAVLMDVQMPIMDGLTATRLIRKDPRFSQLPIIGLTAHAFRNEQDRCFEAGMNDHLGKPVNPNQMYSVLYGHLKKTPKPL